MNPVYIIYLDNGLEYEDFNEFQIGYVESEERARNAVENFREWKQEVLQSEEYKKYQDDFGISTENFVDSLKFLSPKKEYIYQIMSRFHFEETGCTYTKAEFLPKFSLSKYKE